MAADRYQVLLKVADLGNITRAAEELGYTQSAVSRIVADLEREWDLKLLTRGHGGVVLSSDGAALLPWVRAVCNARRELEEVVGELHGLTRGTIRIGTFTSISVHWLPEIMKSFLAQYPGVNFELRSSVAYLEIEDRIAKGQVDCGFIGLPSLLSLEVVPLRRDRLVAVLPPDHPLAAADRYPVARFSRDPFIKLVEERDKELSHIFERCAVRPNLRYAVNDDYAVIAMVANGLGVSLLPELVLRNTPYRVAVKPLDPPQFREIGLAVRSLAALSPATARFIKYVRRWSAGEENPPEL